MALTNLTGKKFRLNTTSQSFAVAHHWQLNFEIVGGADIYNYIAFNIAQNMAYMNTNDGTQLDVVTLGVWADDAYRDIIIHGGNDSQNQTALEWFELYATELPPTYYTVTLNLTGAHVVSQVSQIADTDENLTVAQIAADQYYTLPDNITVTGCDTVQWVKSSGVIVLSYPTANVVITVAGVFYRTYTITGLLTNLTYTGAATIGTGETAYGKLNASGIYYLPETIDVSGCDYVYDEITGDLTLSNPTDDVVIQAAANEIDTSRLAVILYQNNTENNRVNKSSYLYRVGIIYGTLLSETSIINPSIAIYSQGVPIFNYAYIPAFGRYYYVRNVTSISKDYWRIDFTADVLMSFKTEILALTGIVARQENSYNNMIVDTQRPTTNNPVISVISPSVNGVINVEKEKTRYLMSVRSTSAGGTWTNFRKSFISNNKILLSETELEKLLTELNQNSLVEALAKMFTADPQQAFISLRAYPFDLYDMFSYYHTISPSTVNLYNTPTSAVGYYVPDICDNYPHIFLCGEFDFTGSYTWVDTTANYSLYIPFYGFTDINFNDIKGKILSIQYLINFDTGNATVALKAGTTNLNLITIKTLTCNIGIDIPLTRDNSVEIARNYMMSSINAVMSAASGNLLGAGAGIVKAAFDARTGVEARGSVGGPYESMYISTQPFIIKTTPDYITPTNYAHLHGLPSMQSATLSSLSGFTVFDSINIENVSKITEGERGELETLLHTGIIL